MFSKNRSPHLNGFLFLFFNDLCHVSSPYNIDDFVHFYLNSLGKGCELLCREHYDVHFYDFMYLFALTI